MRPDPHAVTDLKMPHQTDLSGQNNLIAEFDDVRVTDRVIEMAELAEYSKVHTINEVREERGLDAVVLRTDLNCAAGTHSLDIGELGWCGHTGSDGSSPGDRVADCQGEGWSGEIVACGQSTPRSAVTRTSPRR